MHKAKLCSNNICNLTHIVERVCKWQADEERGRKTGQTPLIIGQNIQIPVFHGQCNRMQITPNPPHRKQDICAVDWPPVT